MIGICDDLRKSVLQAAIQGRLTKQLTEDGNAEDLYKEIQAEKQKLIKEGKINKEKPLPEISEDDIPFDIPENWKWVRLGSLLHIESGKNLTTASMNGGVYPVYGGNGITGYHDQWLVEPNTIIIGRVGFYCGSVHVAQQKAWVTDNAFITTYPETSIDKDYLVYVLKYLDLGKDNSNATAQPVISGKRVYPMLFPLAPLSEQKRIVTRVDELMKRIDEMEKTEKDITALYEAFPGDMKAALLQAAIQGKLTEQLASDGDAETLYADIQKEKQRLIKEGKIKKEKPLSEITEYDIPFDIPENWKWVKLRNICTKIVDGDHNPPKGELSKSDYLMLSSQNINNDRLVDLDRCRYLSKEKFEVENQRTNVSVGDILLTTVATLGRSCIFNGGVNVCFQRSVSVVTTVIYNHYLKAVFDSLYFQNLMVTESAGTAQKGFYLNQLSESIIPVPPLAEQKRIVEKLDQLLPLCDAIRKNISGGEIV